MLNKDLLNRVSIYNSVYNSDPNKRDRFLKDTDVLSEKYPLTIRNNSESYNMLIRNEKLKRFIDQCYIKKINIFIGGSTPLSSCFVPSNFKPMDVDIYIKNCNLEKLIDIENIIHSVYCNNKNGVKVCDVLVVRCPIVVTWYIYKDGFIIDQIQANILNINSWSEIFVTYHSDIVCVGYDVMLRKFLYLQGRWDNIVNMDKVHVFSNVFSCDSKSSLKRSIEKYRERGFKCAYNFVNKDTSGFGNLDNEKEANIMKEEYGEISGSYFPVTVVSVGNTHEPINDIVNSLIIKYKGRDNICYSQTVVNVYTSNIDVPNEIDLWKLYHDDVYEHFMTEPSNYKSSCLWIKEVEKVLSLFVCKDIIPKILFLSHTCDNVCPLDLKQHNTFIKFLPRNQGKCCDHKISLHSYLLAPEKNAQCPIPGCIYSQKLCKKIIVRSKCQ